jgi:hypothetical protein
MYSTLSVFHAIVPFDCKIKGVRRVVNLLFVGRTNIKRKSVFAWAEESEYTILNVCSCEPNLAKPFTPKMLEFLHAPPLRRDGEVF